MSLIHPTGGRSRPTPRLAESVESRCLTVIGAGVRIGAGTRSGRTP